MERSYRAGTEIIKDPSSKLFKPLKLVVVVAELGEYCNDGNAWVREMHYYPVVWGNSLQKGLQNTRKKQNKKSYKERECKKIDKRQAPRNR